MAADPAADEAGGDKQEVLNLDLHCDEGVWMKQIGHLKDWCPNTRSIRCGLPARVGSKLAAESLRLLFLFKNLQTLDIVLASARSRIEQPLLVGAAELLTLTSLSVTGGHLHHEGLDLGVLTSLRRLHTLRVQPFSDEGLDGLEDEHVATAARLTTLRSLSLRTSENLTDEGLLALKALTQLTQLTLTPLGLEVSREGLTDTLSALTGLRSVGMGLLEARQVDALKPVASAIPSVHLVLNSPDASPVSFFSTCTLCMRTNLVSLRMSTLEATDGAFLLAVGTLGALTELKMGVSLAEGARPFACGLQALSSLRSLRVLEFAVTQELHLPLTVKLVSMLALSWPVLESLSLSAMAKREVHPESLGLLDNFKLLRKLSLFAPLDYDMEDEWSGLIHHVNPRYLPRKLEQLVLECALLSEESSTTPVHRDSSGGDGSRGPTSSGAPTAAGAAGSGDGDGATQGEGRAASSSGGGGAPDLRRGSGSGESARASGDGMGCAAGGGGRTGAPLPALQELELTNCVVSDTHFSALLSGAPGIRHLELNDLSGLTDAGLSAVSSCPRLAHLVVRLPGCPGCTYRSLPALRNATALRHLEWSLAAPLTRGQMEVVGLGVLRNLGGLQHLALEVDAELRVAYGSGPAVARSNSSGASGNLGGTYGALNGSARRSDDSSLTRSVSGRMEVDGVEGERPPLDWKEVLQPHLPLCLISDRQGIFTYDLWNDHLVYVTGRS